MKAAILQPRRQLFRMQEAVVNADPVVNKPAALVVNGRTKDRHNKDKRREYMRAYMANKRAKEKASHASRQV